MTTEKFWRTLDEYGNFEEFQKSLQDEFRPGTVTQPGVLDRREFLSLMSASLALAGLTSCAPSVPEKIVPYVRAPEEIVPGKPLFFATAFPLGGYGLGILAESHMGRPTKIEGNPDHPASLGATDAFAQASVLSLYDPERSKAITEGGSITTWDAFITTLATELEPKRLNKGEGLRILTETVTSPTLASQLKQILAQFPSARWHQYEPVNSDSARAASQMAFGRHVDARYHFDKADVILSLDADFLLTMPGHVRYAREFTSRRRAKPGENGMNRLYVVESTPSTTGAVADHRRAARPSEIYQIASQIHDGATSDPWIDALIRDLQASRGKSIVIAGPQQPPEVHLIAHGLNEKLGNVGQTVEYIEPVEPNAVDQIESLRELVRDMQAGAVDLLVIVGGNPVYTAPVDLEFSKGLANVRLRAHLSLYEDETSAMCHWHVPETHFLESWGDIRSDDGTTTIMQPLINPLYAGKSAYEVLSSVLGQPTRTAYEILREEWGKGQNKEDFEKAWRKSVHDGVVKEQGSRNANVRFREAPKSEIRNANSEFEIVFRPDPTVFDGRFANNGWLQELPKPLTKLVWDNAALVSPASAERLGVINNDVIEIKSEGRAIRAPVWISPGHADNCVTLFLGYGRTRGGTLNCSADCAERRSAQKRRALHTRFNTGTPFDGESRPRAPRVGDRVCRAARLR